VVSASLLVDDSLCLHTGWSIVRSVRGLAWRVLRRGHFQTQVYSFEDLGDIETSTGDLDEAEEIVKQNVESDEWGIGRKVFTSWDIAQRAMQVQTDVMLEKSRDLIKNQLAENKVPLAEDKFFMLDANGSFDTVLDDMITTADTDAAKANCHFTRTWGPAAAGVALDKIDEYVAACEGFITEGTAWLETLELDQIKAEEVNEVYDSRYCVPE
jgi:hypothetical protein